MAGTSNDGSSCWKIKSPGWRKLLYTNRSKTKDEAKFSENWEQHSLVRISLKDGPGGYQAKTARAKHPQICGIERYANPCALDMSQNTGANDLDLLVTSATRTAHDISEPVHVQTSVKTAEAFLLKNAAKIIQQSDEDWVAVAEALIQKTLHASTHTREVKGWDCSQVMLGLPNFKVNDSTILNRMLKAWAKAKKKLTWRPDEGPYPGSPTPKFILSSLKATKTVDDEEGRILLKAFRQAKIKNTNQITATTGEEETLREYCRRNQVTITTQLEAVLDKLETLLPIGDSTGIRWHQAKGWTWETTKHSGRTAWMLSTKQWKNL
ncbi:hypothetical protein R1sor_022110 [Riccia sorocarpa]|uniref:Uncharacterized protein n=1 Tax=Riccia sorocarpa TaxID=122646 RepID=A0ABD3GL39_9MARC